MRHIDYAEILELFAWGMSKLSRPSMGNLLAGYEEYAHARDVDRLLKRLRERKLVTATGRGKDASFVVTPLGQQRVVLLNPRIHWDQPWDGAWRVVTFDLPERRRNERVKLWQAFRRAKLGLLQRSVWVWPRDLKPILHEIIRVEGVPECFCGFVSSDLFLCSNTEIVESAWDFPSITQHHEVYLKQAREFTSVMKRASSLATIGRQHQLEHRAYQGAFSLDPLLPRALWPKGYLGHEVEDAHNNFKRHLRRCFVELGASA